MSGKLLLGLAVSAAIGLGVSAMPAQADNGPNYHPPKHYKPYYKVTKGWLDKRYCQAVVENAVKQKVVGAAHLKVITKDYYDKHDESDKNKYHDYKHKYPKKEKVTIICRFAPYRPILVGYVKDSVEFPCYQKNIVKGYPNYTEDSFAEIDTKKVKYKGRYYNFIKKVLLKCTFEKPYEPRHNYPRKDKD
ncbi:hypothetical protein [Geminicoccus roseus]|uniref:hypothetical protein n=1 Tax=Geminicoccus roseus TaxID=404900 RepID=UPI0012FAC830|nr:hypothetical protein [Geminicoccus roseus]